MSLFHKIMLSAKKQKSLDQLSEQEIEDKFASLYLAFKTDRLTLDKRIDRHQRSRDIIEHNIDNEMQALKETLQSLGHICTDAQTRDVYIKIQHHIEVLETTTSRVSSRAEVYGAVQQELRISKAVDVMVQHVENLKRMYEKDHQELEETKKLLQENRVLGDHGGRSMSSLSVGGATSKLAAGRRRASLAVVSGGNRVQTVLQTSSTSSSSLDLDARTRFQSLVQSAGSLIRRSSLAVSSSVSSNQPKKPFSPQRSPLLASFPSNSSTSSVQEEEEEEEQNDSSEGRPRLLSLSVVERLRKTYEETIANPEPPSDSEKEDDTPPSSARPLPTEDTKEEEHPEFPCPPPKEEPGITWNEAKEDTHMKGIEEVEEKQKVEQEPDGEKPKDVEPVIRKRRKKISSTITQQEKIDDQDDTDHVNRTVAAVVKEEAVVKNSLLRCLGASLFTALTLIVAFSIQICVKLVQLLPGEKSSGSRLRVSVGALLMLLAFISLIFTFLPVAAAQC